MCFDAWYRSKFGPQPKSQAGLVRCLEPWKNINISEVVTAQIYMHVMYMRVEMLTVQNPEYSVCTDPYACSTVCGGTRLPDEQLAPGCVFKFHNDYPSPCNYS